MQRLARDHGVPSRLIGTVTEAASGFVMHTKSAGMKVGLNSMKALFFDTIPNIMDAGGRE